MPMQRANFPKSLEAGLNAVWMSNERNFPEEWPRLFERKKSNKAVEEQVLRAGLGAGQIKAEERRLPKIWAESPGRSAT